MPLSNLGKTHITAAQITAFDKALTQLENIAIAITQNLNAEERQRYKRISEKNKLFTNKTSDYHQNQPALQSPDVDWPEFELDYADRVFAGTRMPRLETVMRMLQDFKIVHDYDNFRDALVDYDYTVHKQRSTPGFDVKRKDIQQFFPAVGVNRKQPAKSKKNTPSTSTAPAEQ